MQTPQSLAEAKAMLKTEEDKALGTLDVIIGSRWLMAILATCVLAFGLHAVYAPTWLPSFTGLSLANFGLPSHLELTADLRNLLAQGYVPAGSGGQLLIVQSPRAIRGGLNLTF